MIFNLALLGLCIWSTAEAFDEENAVYPYPASFAFLLLSANHTYYASKLAKWRKSVEQEKEGLLRFTHKAVCNFFDKIRDEDMGYFDENEGHAQAEYNKKSLAIIESFKGTDEINDLLIKLNTFYAGALKLRGELLPSRMASK